MAHVKLITYLRISLLNITTMPKHFVIRVRNESFFRGITFDQKQTSEIKPHTIVFDQYVATIFDDTDFGQSAMKSVEKLLELESIPYTIHTFKIP